MYKIHIDSLAKSRKKLCHREGKMFIKRENPQLWFPYTIHSCSQITPAYLQSQPRLPEKPKVKENQKPKGMKLSSIQPKLSDIQPKWSAWGKGLLSLWAINFKARQDNQDSEVIG